MSGVLTAHGLTRFSGDDGEPYLELLEDGIFVSSRGRAPVTDELLLVAQSEGRASRSASDRAGDEESTNGT